MDKKLNRREFVKVGAAVVANAIIGLKEAFDDLVAIGDLDGMAEKPEAPESEAVQESRSVNPCRNSARAWLKAQRAALIVQDSSLGFSDDPQLAREAIDWVLDRLEPKDVSMIATGIVAVGRDLLL